MTVATAKQSERSGRANRGSKPGELRGGRTKGVPNKISGDVKAMVLAALDKAGGANYLLRQSEENPVAFMSLVGKVLPLQITGDKANPIAFVLTEQDKAL